ncbi:MAG: GGDEF domain-containing protein [Chloroflexi bacterium]|nr:GGDEF domain-containing protein [Chloroflexota bacterium]MCL5275162.1 GGDEF domain-containing protein [Chloroflexota bacterium]
MDMNFDTRTMTLAVTVVGAVLTFIMITYWIARKSYPGFGLWTASFGLGIVAGGLTVLSGSVPDLVSVVIGSLCFSAVPVLITAGIRRFYGGRRIRIYLIPLVTELLLLLFFLYLYNDIVLRTLCVSFINAVIFFWGGVELFIRSRRRLRSAAITTGVVLVAYGLNECYHIYNALHTTIRADLFDPAMALALAQPLYLLVMLTLTVPLAFGFLNMMGERLEAELSTAEAALRHMATTDPLTGVHNVGNFKTRAYDAIARARRTKRPLTLLVMDVDRFKQINDSYGHAAGDEVLKGIAARCQEHLRGADVLARIGGDEFAALLPDTDLAGAEVVANHLRRAVAQVSAYEDGTPIGVTISVGGTILLPNDADINAMFKRADTAMYEAKATSRSERTTVETYAQPAPTP